MGYFSNLAAQEVLYDHDHSYTPPEKQLLWRLEELEDRFEELTGNRCAYEYRASFSDKALRYILPEHFKSATDVAQAIELAIYDLAVYYGIHVREKPVEEVPEMDEITGMQISFLDVLSMQPLHRQPMAA